jgi:hypothetical protein
MERAVEEVLLRDIVRRYSRAIHSSNMKELDGLKREDWQLCYHRPRMELAPTEIGIG